jgi:hypothetical protein
MAAPDPPEDEAGFDEELDVEPSTSRGWRPPSGRRHTPSRRLFEQGATTTMTDDSDDDGGGDGGGGDDDDDDLGFGDGGEQTADTLTSSALGKPY